MYVFERIFYEILKRKGLQSLAKRNIKYLFCIFLTGMNKNNNNNIIIIENMGLMWGQWPYYNGEKKIKIDGHVLGSNKKKKYFIHWHSDILCPFGKSDISFFPFFILIFFIWKYIYKYIYLYEKYKWGKAPHASNANIL